MQVKLAESSGFCFGVKRAVDTVWDKLESGRKIYTFGPIVHNDEVVRELEEAGVEVIPDKEALMKMEVAVGDEKPIVVIRAHGVPPVIYDILEEKGFECVDATCPFVKRIHKVVREESEQGRPIVILGNPIHPEVEGILGWCKGSAIALQTQEEIEKFVPENSDKFTLVEQTTFNHKKFLNTVDIFNKKGYNVNVVNTICNATEDRQRSARALAKEADVMIVIGGKHSSNSAKLYEICKEECDVTYFIQTLDDLHLELPKSVRLVGITAGASTPNKLIEEVQNYVRINF